MANGEGGAEKTNFILTPPGAGLLTAGAGAVEQLGNSNFVQNLIGADLAESVAGAGKFAGGPIVGAVLPLVIQTADGTFQNSPNPAGSVAYAVYTGGGTAVVATGVGTGVESFLATTALASAAELGNVVTGSLTAIGLTVLADQLPSAVNKISNDLSTISNQVYNSYQKFLTGQNKCFPKGGC